MRNKAKKCKIKISDYFIRPSKSDFWLDRLMTTSINKNMQNASTSEP